MQQLHVADSALRMSTFAGSDRKSGFPMHHDYEFEDPRTLKELEIMRIESIIRNTPEWWIHLSSPVAVQKLSKQAHDSNTGNSLHVPRSWRQLLTASGRREWRALNAANARWQQQFRYAVDECLWQSRQFTGPIRPAAVDGVFMRDDMDLQLRSELLQEIRHLRSLPAAGSNTVDRHPDSEHIVRLVDPSMYAYEKGVTQVLPGSSALDIRSPPFTHFLGLDGIVPEGNRCQMDSDVLWLPSEFYVSTKTPATDFASGDDVDASIRPKCSINSYISSLHPEQHRSLYQKLEQLFVHVVPILETVLEEVSDGSGRRNSLRVHPSDDRDCDSIGVPAFIPHIATQTQSKKGKVNLYNRSLQVFVKIVSVELDPSTEYEGGSWHVEGVQEERIVATACCYLDEDNIQGGDLSFRTPVKDVINMYDIAASWYGIQDLDLLVQPRGTCSTLPGRTLAWPNTLEHRVEAVRLMDRNLPGRRTVCCFHLVDPTLRIRSTATVPPQPHAWFAAHADASLTVQVPERVLRYKITDMLQHPGFVSCGLSYAEACKRSKKATKERRERSSILLRSRVHVPYHAFLIG